ncbi:hypothetical protein TI05_07020 [Achromatium sp. WMS3]|nr:hypothetical protein TI05_07020 [Achromatium sp. WMS3]
MKATISYLLLAILSLLAFSTTAANRASPTRVVVVPFYTETGCDVRNPCINKQEHYRRISRSINNQLVRHGFEVINPFGHEWNQEDHDRMAQRARSDSMLAVKALNRRYSTDILYLLWLDIKYLDRNTPEGYCKVQIRIEGEGYDSAARDLGLGIEKTSLASRRDCEDAVITAEKELSRAIGRLLTGYGGQPRYGRHSRHTRRYSRNDRDCDDRCDEEVSIQITTTAGALQRRSDQFASLLNVRLEGVTSYEWGEIFGKVINTVPGVVVADLYNYQSVPNNPQASYMIWRVRIETNSDIFRFQANVISHIKRIIDNGGWIKLRGTTYNYSPAEVDVLKGIRIGTSHSREAVFVIDRDLAQERDFTGRHDPYQAPNVRRRRFD